MLLYRFNGLDVQRWCLYMHVCVSLVELPWMSSLNVQYLLRYLLSRRKALTFAKSSNWIRQSIPYLETEELPFTSENQQRTSKHRKRDTMKLPVVVKVRAHLIEVCTHTLTHVESSPCFQRLNVSPEGALSLHTTQHKVSHEERRFLRAQSSNNVFWICTAVWKCLN